MKLYILATEGKRKVDSPYGYWYEALEVVARTLRPDDWQAITATKAIRKAVLLPDEAVTTYIAEGDRESVTLTVLTDHARVVRFHFHDDAVQHFAVLVSHVHYLGGELTGLTSGMTEVWGFDTISYRFVLDTSLEPIALTLPISPPGSIAGKEEIEFAQKLIAAIAAVA